MLGFRGIAPLVALLALFLASTVSGSVHAQTPGYDSTDGCAGSWQRQFGIDVLILDCNPGFATAHDRAYMYSRRPVTTSGDWRSQLNFDDAVWIFDAGARGTPSLLIDFRRDGSAAVADLYDDRGGDGIVRYGLERGYPRSAETRFPPVRVVAPDGWWVKDGRTNFNLRIAVDGPVSASDLADLYLHNTAIDGSVDVDIAVGDPDGNGRPNWQVIQAHPPVHPSAGIYRTMVAVNEADDEAVPQTYILWPHLGYAGEPRPTLAAGARPPLSSLPFASYGYFKSNRNAAPPIQVDWERARIVHVGQFVASEDVARGWSVRSVAAISPPSAKANEENPAASYDLANRNDGSPDLRIRNVHYFVDDPFAAVPLALPAHDLSYSWDLEHDGRFDYKIGLFGRRPMPGTTVVGGLPIETVPYGEYPSWAIGHAWEEASFVVAEMPQPAGSGWAEQWCLHCTPAQQAYHAGLTRTQPTESFATIGRGLRGEYALTLREPVSLYVSAIDGKVHLYRAQGGIWAVDERQMIRYTALSGPYVDRWEKLEDGTVAETLVHAGDYLIYADSTGAYLARFGEAPAQAVFLPPSDQAGIERMRLQLSRAAASDASDLRAIFDRLGTDKVSLPGAVVWDIQRDGASFRFQLLIGEATTAPGALSGLSPGRWTVTYAPAEGLAARPSAAPAMEVSPPRLRGDPARALEPIRLTTTVRNTGDEAIASLPVLLIAGRPDEPDEVVATSFVALASSEAAAVDVIWRPPASGEWHLRSIALAAQSSLSDTTLLDVSAGASTDLSSILRAQQLKPAAAGAISASLTLVMAISAGVGLMVWRTARAGAKDEEP